MAVLQSTFGEDPAVGFAGMDADGELSNIISRTLESASAGFGKAVFRGTDDRGVDTTPAAGELMGFTRAKPGLPVTATRAADTYVTGDTVSIKNRGKIWVIAGEAVTDGAQVYITSGGAIVDTSTSNTIADGWFFDDTAANGALVRIVRR